MKASIGLFPLKSDFDQCAAALSGKRAFSGVRIHWGVSLPIASPVAQLHSFVDA
jgi:hypothetical protein